MKQRPESGLDCLTCAISLGTVLEPFCPKVVNQGTVGNQLGMPFDGYATAPARLRAKSPDGDETEETAGEKQNMARVIVYGPPGSGKTTVCKLISEQKGLVLPRTESPHSVVGLTLHCGLRITATPFWNRTPLNATNFRAHPTLLPELGVGALEPGRKGRDPFPPDDATDHPHAQWMCEPCA